MKKLQYYNIGDTVFNWLQEYVSGRIRSIRLDAGFVRGAPGLHTEPSNI